MKNQTKELFYKLYIDFSFLPQVILAVIFYKGLTFDSGVLLSEDLRTAFLVTFVEISVLSLLTIQKRFMFPRFLLIGAYVQLMLVVVWFNFEGRLRMFGKFYNNAYFWIFALTLSGITLVKYNIIALKKLRKLKSEINIDNREIKDVKQKEDS